MPRMPDLIGLKSAKRLKGKSIIKMDAYLERAIDIVADF